MKAKKALLIVDVQNDFCTGGALPVPKGDEVVPVLNKYIRVFYKKKLPIFASRDWHPKKTKHFKDFGGLWPRHCIQGTRGAEFHPDLKLTKETIIVSGGMDPERDSYSMFEAYDSKGKDFLTLLKSMEIEELYIGGLATDYCVRATALDALKYGFKVNLLVDAIRGIDEEDSRRAIKEMIAHGAKKLTFNRLSKSMS